MLPSVRITAVRIHELSAPLAERSGYSLSWNSSRAATLVEVQTDAGLTGWGDGEWGGEMLLGAPHIVIGRSPFEMEGIFEELRPPSERQRRMGETTAGGLDVALWDIAGQVLGKPIADLLGRRYRDRARPYCTALYRKDWPDLGEGLAAEAAGWKARGFRAVKMKIGYGPEIDFAIVRRVREALGPEAGLAVDSNCAYDAGTAAALGKRLEPFGLLWWEEPIVADDLAGYARLKACLPMPLAGGETFSTDRIIRDLLQPRLVDIVQPEIALTGFTGARRITHSAWLNHVRLVPHNWSTAVRTAAILHWMSTVPPVTEALEPPEPIFELDRSENPLRDAVVSEAMDIEEDGTMAVPTAPGLGIHVVPEAVAEFRSRLIQIPR